MTNDSTPSPGLSAVSVDKAEINLALTKAGYNYGLLLQQASDITFRKDNLEQDFAPLKKVREAEKLLKDLENPYTAQWQAWNANRKSLVDPLTKVISEKTAAYKKLADELKADKLVLDTEKQRKAGIQAAISSFVLDYSGKIAGATTEAALLAFEREINLEGTRTAKYQEFLPTLKSNCEPLRSLISAQKTKVRELATLRTQANHASVNGLDEVLMESMGKMEQLQGEIHENTIKVQEAAINGQITNEIPQAEEILPAVPKARRTSWAWEVTNLELFAKKRPDFVQFVPRKEVLDAMVRELKEKGTIQEIEKDGLKIYKKELY